MKMNSAHLLFITLLLLIWCSVSFTWSSSISSIISIRGFMSQPELIETLANGAQMAMHACQNAFKWDKWNCPEPSFSRRIKEKATKEQAVVHAVLSAGLVHAVTRNCSMGVLQSCGCNPKLRSSIPANPKYITSSGLVRPKDNLKKSKTQWSWGGCSDDVEYGQSLAKKVLDDLEVGFDSQTYANLHNNLVGRMIIRNTMIKKCRCHGVSGSCSLQTCWLQVAPFQKVAEVIRQRYKKAVKIIVENRATFEPNPTAPPRGLHDLSNHQLAFIERSPDYCLPDSATGWPGTKGRPCLRGRSKKSTLLERRSCKNLCRHCGHRVRKYKRQVKKNCNCSFIWCCEVKCDNCTEIVEEFFCD